MAVGGADLAELGSDVPIFEDSVGCLLFRVISFQGLLAEFAREKVREGFLSGQFMSVDYPNAVLASLAKIRELMLPTLRPQLSASRSKMAAYEVKFFTELLSKSKNEQVDLNGLGLPVQKTFAEWFSFFQVLSACSYWRKIPLDDGSPMLGFDLCPGGSHGPAATGSSLSCGSKHASIFGTNLKSGGNSGIGKQFSSKDERLPQSSRDCGSYEMYREELLQKKVQSSPPVNGRYSRKNVWDPKREYGSDSSSLGPRHNKAKPLGHPPVRRHREFHSKRLYLSDSDSQYSDSGSSSDRRAAAHRSSGVSHRRLCKALEHLDMRREVVPPGNFDGKGGASLKWFLREYEEFFKAKFHGNNRHQAKVLGQYLMGSAKQAYEAVDGSRLKYSQLKGKLLDWYQGEKVSIHQHAEREFSRAQMLREESYSILLCAWKELLRRHLVILLKKRNVNCAEKCGRFHPKALFVLWRNVRGT